MLETATGTMFPGLDRTTIGADQVRPARHLPAVPSFHLLRFHRSLLPSQLLVASTLKRVCSTELSELVPRQDDLARRNADKIIPGLPARLQLLTPRPRCTCSSRPRLAAEPFRQQGRGALTEIPLHLRRRDGPTNQTHALASIDGRCVKVTGPAGFGEVAPCASIGGQLGPLAVPSIGEPVAHGSTCETAGRRDPTGGYDQHGDRVEHDARSDL